MKELEKEMLRQFVEMNPKPWQDINSEITYKEALQKMTVADLKYFRANMRITGVSKLTKKQLVEHFGRISCEMNEQENPLLIENELERHCLEPSGNMSTEKNE